MYILVALGAALCFSVAVVVQQFNAAKHGAQFSLVLQPWWLLGGLVDFCGFLLQVLALHLGGVVGVQVVLVSVLPIGLLFGRVRLHRDTWAAGALLAAGIAGVLAAADPRPGRPHHELPAVIAVTAVVAVVVAVTTLRGVPRMSRPTSRSLGRAVGAAMLFALTATLAAAASDQVTGGGYLSTLRHPELYLLAVVASIGLALEQQAFASGSLQAALVVITLLDPVTSLVLGIVVAGDRLRGGGYGVAAVFSGLVATAGVVLLARSAPGAGHAPPVARPVGRAGTG